MILLPQRKQNFEAHMTSSMRGFNNNTQVNIPLGNVEWYYPGSTMGINWKKFVFIAGFLKRNFLLLNKSLNLPHTQEPKLNSNMTERKQYP